MPPAAPSGGQHHGGVVQNLLRAESGHVPDLVQDANDLAGLLLSSHRVAAPEQDAAAQGVRGHLATDHAAAPGLDTGGHSQAVGLIEEFSGFVGGEKQDLGVQTADDGGRGWPARSALSPSMRRRSVPGPGLLDEEMCEQRLAVGVPAAVAPRGRRPRRHGLPLRVPRRLRLAGDRPGQPNHPPLRSPAVAHGHRGLRTPGRPQSGRGHPPTGARRPTGQRGLGPGSRPCHDRASLGVALHEEATLDLLVADLSRPA